MSFLPLVAMFVCKGIQLIKSAEPSITQLVPAGATKVKCAWPLVIATDLN